MRIARRLANEARYRNLGLARAGIAIAGFGVFGFGVWLRRRGRSDRLRAVRLGLLAALVVASFAGYYNFFQAGHVGGFKGADVFHYYVGSKYFGEIGYFDLYPCTLAALIEDGRQDPMDLPEVRDQRTLRIQTPEATRADVSRCPERFEPERWADFKRDIAFFRQRVLGGSWSHLFVDHGYNPTPIWSFVGGLFSRTVPAEPDTFPVLIALDRVLIVATALLIVWAFGFEAACLAMLVWGVSPLWSYNWIGDAFLRNLWLFSAVLGICLLERGRYAASGAALALAAGVRIFPGIFVAAVMAHALQRAWRAPAASRKRLLRKPGLLLVGGAVAAVVLVAAGAFGTGRGPGAYLEFREKMTGVVAQAGVNKVGLSALANHLVYTARTVQVTTPEGRSVRVDTPAPVTETAVRSAQGLLVLLGLFAFWRALPQTSTADAALLGFALIPLLTSPANYYYPFVLAGAMLSARRPWLGVALGVAATAWIAAWYVWFLDDARYLAYDAIAVLFALVTLVGVAVTPAPRTGAETGPAAPTST